MESTSRAARRHADPYAAATNPVLERAAKTRLARAAKGPPWQQDEIDRALAPQLHALSVVHAPNVGVALMPKVVLPDAFMFEHNQGVFLSGTTNYPTLARLQQTAFLPIYALEGDGHFGTDPITHFFASVDQLPSYAIRKLPPDYPNPPAHFFEYGPEVWAPEWRRCDDERTLMLATYPHAGYDGKYAIGGHIGLDPTRPETFEPLVDAAGREVALIEPIEERGRLIPVIDATYRRLKNGDAILTYKEDRNSPAIGGESVLCEQRIRIRGNKFEKLGRPRRLIQSIPNSAQRKVIEGQQEYQRRDLRYLNMTQGVCFDGHSYTQTYAVFGPGGELLARGEPYMSNDHPLVRESGLMGVGHTMAFTPSRDLTINGKSLRRGCTYQVGSGWPLGAEFGVWTDARTPVLLGPVGLDAVGRLKVGNFKRG